MKRLPLALSFILFLALCATLVYWGLQLFAPPPRAVSAPPRPAVYMPPSSAAAGLFGQKVANGQSMTTVQLRGIILARRSSDSVAILVPEGGAPRSLRVSGEVMPGVTVKEIHPRYVVLSDHGVDREVKLATFAVTSPGLTENRALPPRMSPEPAPAPITVPVPVPAPSIAAPPAPAAPPPATSGR